VCTRFAKPCVLDGGRFPFCALLYLAALLFVGGRLCEWVKLEGWGSMAIGQLKVLVLCTYGIADGAAVPTSPDRGK
jgi:hypothetical protein